VDFCSSEAGVKNRKRKKDPVKNDFKFREKKLGGEKGKARSMGGPQKKRARQMEIDGDTRGTLKGSGGGGDVFWGANCPLI